MTATFLLDAHGQPLKIVGYACLFDTPITIAGQTEVIAPGAFLPSLRYGANVRACIDHRRSATWASADDGTLRLWQDATGLAFTAMVPASLEGRGLARAVADGCIGSSFYFRPFKTEQTASGYIVQAATLTEISLTTSPAYPTRAWLVPFESMNYMPDHALFLRRRWIGGQLKARREARDHVVQTCGPSRPEQAAKAHHEANARRPLHTRARQRRAA